MRLDNLPMAGVIEFQGEKKSRFQLVSVRSPAHEIPRQIVRPVNLS
jgi:hypothetical protein